MRSRAAYKLMEIDDRAYFLRKGARVIDLGAAPGGGVRSPPSESGRPSRDAWWQSTFSRWILCPASISPAWIFSTKARRQSLEHDRRSGRRGAV